METHETMNEQQSAAIYGGSTTPAPGDPPGPTTPPAPEQGADEADPDIATLIAEAEQRGYLRGRNEAASEMMERPAMWQPACPDSPAGRLTSAADSFLSGLRPGVWDTF